MNENGLFKCLKVKQRKHRLSHVHLCQHSFGVKMKINIQSASRVIKVGRQLAAQSLSIGSALQGTYHSLTSSAALLP